MCRIEDEVGREWIKMDKYGDVLGSVSSEHSQQTSTWLIPDCHKLAWVNAIILDRNPHAWNKKDIWKC